MTEEQNTPPNIWNDFAARALRTGAPVPSVQIEFDAEMARLGLAWNFTNNRKPKPAVVKTMMASIAEGSFAAGTVLRIAYDSLINHWVLVDGQHRLAAVEASGTKQWFVVTVDSRSADTAYATLDRLGTMRTEADSVNGRLGWKTRCWTSILGGINIIKNNFSHYSNAHKNSPAETIEISELAKKFEAVLKRIDELPKTELFSPLMRAPSSATWILAGYYQPDSFFPWIERAMADKTITVSSTEMRLRDLCVLPSRENFDRARLMVITAHVWNAHFLGRAMQQLPAIRRRHNFDDGKFKFPGIAGTPYAK
jgi:hypothetical protein